MPNTTLVITSTVDALGGDYSTDKSKQYFGVSLSAALRVPDTVAGAPDWQLHEDDLEFMRTWNWTMHSLAIAVWTPGAADSIRRLTDVPQFDEKNGSVSLKTAVDSQLRDVRRWQLAKPGRVATAFGWHPEDTDKQERRLWPTALARFSALPHPYQRQLNLSFIVPIPVAQLAGVQAVLVAPQFSVAHKSGLLNFSIEDFQTPVHTPNIGVGARAFEWKYRGTPFDDRCAVSYISGANPTVPTRTDAAKGSRPLVDVKSQWIFKSEDAAAEAYAHDWATTLLADLSDGFDLSRALLEAARDVAYGFDRNGTAENVSRKLSADEQEQRTRLENGLPMLVQLLFATMRDLADFGARRGPSGESFLDRMLALWQPLNDAESMKKREGVYAFISRQRAVDTDSSYSNWIALLRKHLPDVASANAFRLPSSTEKSTGNPVHATELHDAQTLSSVSEWSGSLTASIEELQRVHDWLRDDFTLASIVAAQWELIPESEATVPLLMPEFLNSIRSQRFGDAPAVRLLAQGVLGAAVVVDQVKSAKVSEHTVDGTGVYGKSAWDLLLGRNESAVAGADISVELPERFRQALVMYAEQRCLYGIPTFLPAQPLHSANAQGCTGIELWTLLRPGILRHANEHRARIVDARRAIALTGATAVAPTRAPHPITFQVDRMAPDSPAGSQADCDDFHRRFSGSGVLMRRVLNPSKQGEGANLWRCLNFAAATEIASVSNSEPWPAYEPWDKDQRPSLVPLRPSYTDDLRQAFLTYDGLPLVGRSPMADLLRHSPEETRLTDAQSLAEELPTFKSPIDWMFPDTAKSNWAKVPALSFGESYEIAPFVVANCGALPSEIADANDPARYREPNEMSEPPKDVVRSIEYRRRVRLGAPRVWSAKSVDESAVQISEVIPPVPDRCFPRLRELFSANDQSGEAAPVLILCDQSEVLELATLPAEHAVTVRPPATDIYTWDRWVNNDATDTNIARRRAVWRDYSYLLQRNHELAIQRRDSSPISADHPKLQDVSLNDPAVKGLYVELQEIAPYAKGREPQIEIIGHHYIDVTRPVAANADIVEEQGGLINLRFVAKNKGNTEIQKSDVAGRPEVQFTLIRQRLYRIRVYSVVDSAEWANRSDRIYEPSELKSVLNGYAIAPLDFLVEVASPKMPQASELHPVFKPRFEVTPRKLHVEAELCQQTAGECAWLVGPLELRRQRWIWDGRPVSRMPAVSNVQGFSRTEWLDVGGVALAGMRFEELLRWETAQFGTRHFSDSVRLEMERQQGDPLAPDVVRYRWTESLHDDLRALYFRFALIARSRYEGAFGKDLSVLAVRKKVSAEAAAGGVSVDRTWRPFFVPCARKGFVPAPVLKVLLPLTRRPSHVPGDSTERLPGILAVFRDVWYDYGGIVEEIQAEVVTASRTVFNVKMVPELAPDPIASREKSDWSKAEFHASGETPSNVVGPVGHSFDGSASGAFFGSTSFVIHLPEVTSPAGKAIPDWAFVKLQFRRLLYGAGYYSDDDKFTISNESAATPAAWMQYIPPFDIEVKDSGLAGAPRQFCISESGQRITIESNDLAGMPVAPRTSRFAILTREVVNGLRPLDREPQESFVAVYKAESLSYGITTVWNRLVSAERAPVDEENETYVLRTIDVQFVDAKFTRPDAVPSEEKLWGHLYDVLNPESDPKLADANWPPSALGASVNTTVERTRARIIAVSQPLHYTPVGVANVAMTRVQPCDIAGDNVVESIDSANQPPMLKEIGGACPAYDEELVGAERK